MVADDKNRTLQTMETRMKELETAVAQYVSAIKRRDAARIIRFCRVVEETADRLGYTNHARLQALHSRAEVALTERSPA